MKRLVSQRALGREPADSRNRWRTRRLRSGQQAGTSPEHERRTRLEAFGWNTVGQRPGRCGADIDRNRRGQGHIGSAVDPSRAFIRPGNFGKTHVVEPSLNIFGSRFKIVDHDTGANERSKTVREGTAPYPAGVGSNLGENDDLRAKNTQSEMRPILITRTVMPRIST